MIAVFRRELRAFFHSLRAGLFFGGMLLLTGLFTSLYCLYYGYTEFEYALFFLTVGLGLLLPLVALPMFAAERSEGGERLLRTLPVRPRDVILGKYLAGVTVVGLLSLVMMLVPILLGFWGEVYYPTTYVAVFAFFLMGCAMLAMELFFSYAIRVKWFARYVCIFVPFVLAILAMVTRFLPEPFRTALNAISIYGSFSSFVFGLVDLRALVLYLTLAALFVVLTLLCAKQNRSNPKERGAGIKKTVALLVTVTLVLNVGAFLIPAAHAQMDMTESKRFTIRPETKELLKSLEGDVTLYVLEGEGENAELEYFLGELAAKSSRLHLKYIKAEENTELLEKAGLTLGELSESSLAALEYAVIVDGERRTTMIDYYSMLQYQVSDSSVLSFLGQLKGSTVTSPISWYDYQQYVYYLEMFSQQDSQYQQYFYSLIDNAELYFNGETLLTAAVEYVSARIIPTQYVLTGHGEAPLEDTGLGYLVSETGYHYENLDLTSIDCIPEDASAVLVLAPEEDYTESELAMMREYLAGGGRMTVVTGEEQLSLTGLMSLLEEYGMTAQTGFVGEMVEQEIETEESESEKGESEEGESEEGVEGEQDEEQTPETEIVPSYTVDAAVNGDHEMLSYFAGVSGWIPSITNGNAIVLEDTSELELTPLLLTSENAFIGEETEQTEARVLGAVSEREDGGALTWFTGASSYLSSRIDMAVYGNNLCLMLAMDWTDLVYESKTVAVEPVFFGANYLAASDTVLTVFSIVTVLLVPLALVGLSWITVYKRKKA